MRPTFFITIIILFLLTACGTPAPQVTVTSEVTVTLTPAATLTATPTATFTPTPAFSPGVEAIIADEKTLPEVSAFLTTAKEGGFAAEVTADGNIEILGVIKIDPITGKAEREPYPFTLPDGKVMQLTTTGQVGENVTIETDAEGNTRIYTPASKYTKEAGWVRKQVAKEGLEAENPVYEREEFMAAVLSENAWLKETGQMDENSPARKWSERDGRELIGADKGEVETLSGDKFEVENSNFYFDNEMYLSKNGIWVQDVSTSFYVWRLLKNQDLTLDQDLTLVRWRGKGKGGEMVVKEMVVAGNWGDNLDDAYGDVKDVFKKTNMNFFNFEEGSEFDLTFIQQ